MYFSREFSLEATIQISSQSVKICSSYAASQFEKHDFENNAFKVLTLFFIYKQKFVIYSYSAIPAPHSCPSRLRFFSSSFLDDLEDL